MPTTLRHPAREPSHPGALLAEIIENMGLGKAEMARRLGITRTALYNVLDQKSGVTADLALRIDRVTGTDAEALVRMQATHDLWVARRRLAERENVQATAS
jgi:antitoxin HigA-1